MNKYSVLTLFPDIVNQGLNYSIVGRAIKEGLIDLNLINIRDFAINDYGQVDDKLYGGGTGMLMMAEPILKAWLSIFKPDPEQYLAELPAELTLTEWQNYLQQVSEARTFFLSPKGQKFDQNLAAELAQEDHLVFLCGHYEGIDQRILDTLQVEELSLGDFVLTGGESAIVVMLDAITRLIPGVLPEAEAHQADSFAQGLLEEPQYTRPANWRGLEVPDILLSGHQAKIEKYRKSKSLLETFLKRSDLLENKKLSESEWLLLIDSLNNN